MNVKVIIYRTARLVAAVIMLQTFYFRFTGSEESVYIFSTIGMEPWGRIGVGVMELIASLLLISTATAWSGAVLTFGLMTGAIGIHLTTLGIEVKGDGGYLFILSLIVMVCAAYILYTDRKKLIKLWIFFALNSASEERLLFRALFLRPRSHSNIPSMPPVDN